MEGVKSICTMREIMLGFNKLEEQLIDNLGIDLKEALVICCLAEKQLSTSEIASTLELKMSHTSKIIASLEKKELLFREFGQEDKRRMFFKSNKKGVKLYHKLKSFSFNVPLTLKGLF